MPVEFEVRWEIGQPIQYGSENLKVPLAVGTHSVRVSVTLIPKSRDRYDPADAWNFGINVSVWLTGRADEDWRVVEAANRTAADMLRHEILQALSRAFA